MVDWIGLPVFGFPERDLDLYGSLRSFSEIFEEKYERVRVYRKRVIIAELGVAGEPKYQESWIKQLYRDLSDTERFPLLKSIVYYDSMDHAGAWEERYSVPDWRIHQTILSE